MISKVIIIAVLMLLYLLTDKFILDPMGKRADYFRGEHFNAVRNNETEKSESCRKKWFLFFFFAVLIRVVLTRDSVTYKNAVRFGQVIPNKHRPVFYFENMSGADEG